MKSRPEITDHAKLLAHVIKDHGRDRAKVEGLSSHELMRRHLTEHHDGGEADGHMHRPQGLPR